jgi:Tol biopolymer transport system component
MFELLLVLVRNPDRILEKEFLLEAVWGNVFVEEGNISFNIRQLRKALNDDAQAPSYIETIPRRGYRFIAKVDEIVIEENTLASESVLIANAKSRPRWRRRIVATVSVAAVLIAAFALAAWLRSTRVVQAAPILTSPFALEKLSTDGEVSLAAISRDGKMVVYSRRNAGKQSLWLMQPGTSDNTQIIPPSDFSYYGLAIAPDTKAIYFSRRQISGQRQTDIYREPIYGGVPQRIVSEAQGWFSLSPNGDKISFVRCPYEEDEYCSLWIADSSDGGNERKLASRPFPLRIADNKISPDGKTIAFAVGQSRNSSNEFGVALLDIESGIEREFTTEKFINIQYLTWLPDQKAILITARRQPDKNFRIWQVLASSGDATALTDDSQSYSELSLSGDGSVLVSSQVAPNFHLNIYQTQDPAQPPRRLSNSLSIGFAPDGGIVFSSARTGNREIWSIAPDGSDERQLTNDSSDDVAAIVSEDNKLIFFASNRTGKIQIWKMNRDGSNQTQVTFAEGGYPSFVSADGRWVYYRSAIQKIFGRVSIQDNKEERIFDRVGPDAALSPDGNHVAQSETVNGENVLNIISVPDGKTVATYHFAKPKANLIAFVWSHDGKYLAYILTDELESKHTLWFQSLDRQPARKMADLREGDVFESSGLALSPDNKALAISEGTWNHDAVLIRGLK